MPVADLDSAIEEISGIIKQQIEATYADGPTTLRLTAGRDSRMLLACSRRWADDIDFVTADLRDLNSSIDCRVAGEIARIAGVPHRILPWVDPDERDLEIWLYRTGFGAGVVRGWQGTTTYRLQLDSRRSDLHGVAGEVARGALWRRDDLPGDHISAGRLLSHCRCPESPETMRFVSEWVRHAPSLDALQLLDLFYVEQRAACWAGVWTYAEAGARYQSFPMAHRRFIELVMGLPSDVRRSGAMHEKVIEQEWPELMSAPFNRGNGILRARGSMKRLIGRSRWWLRHPKRAVSRARAR